MSFTLPTFVTCKLASDPKSYRPVKIRKTPDLPFVTEVPSWGESFPNQDPSYYFVVEGKRNLIKFINDDWYHIVWSVRGKQYHVCKDGFIHQTAHNHY
jgi:hypothetical protein